MATVVVHNVLKLQPLPNSPTGTLPLTHFDASWLTFPPVELLFFYQLTDSTHQIFHSTILPNLKHSLSQTLHHFPPLFGQIKWPPHHPTPSIFYSSTDTVSLTVAESTADFNSLSSNNHLRQPSDLHPLIPNLSTSHESAELISIQITLFRNRGFCIAVSAHHGFLDGKSLTIFMKSWAYISKTQEINNLPLEITPCFDRNEILHNPDGISFMKKWFCSQDSKSLKLSSSLQKFQNPLRATFVISKPQLKNLRNDIIQHFINRSKSIHLSTFVVTYAYILSCLIKSKRDSESDSEWRVSFTADYRAKMGKIGEIGKVYFGNCVIVNFMVVKAEEVMDGVYLIAEKLSEAVKGLESKTAIEGLQELFSYVKEGKPEWKDIGVAGSNKFGLYEVDFGWGRPEKIEVVSIDRTGGISLCGSRDGDGVEVGVVLEDGDMVAFVDLFHHGLRV